MSGVRHLNIERKISVAFRSAKVAFSSGEVVNFIGFVGWDQRASRAPAHRSPALTTVGRRFAGPALHEFTASERKATLKSGTMLKPLRPPRGIQPLRTSALERLTGQNSNHNLNPGSMEFWRKVYRGHGPA